MTANDRTMRLLALCEVAAKRFVQASAPTRRGGPVRARPDHLFDPTLGGPAVIVSNQERTS